MKDMVVVVRPPPLPTVLHKIKKTFLKCKMRWRIQVQKMGEVASKCIGAIDWDNTSPS